MQLVFSLFLMAIPALLVALVHRLWRGNPTRAQWFMWGIVAIAWAITAVTWAIYARQQDDVGLIVHGIIGGATLTAAVLATLTAVVIRWRT